MGDVIKWTGNTRLPIPVADVCEESKDLEYVLILGLDKDGHFVVRCSEADIYKATYLANQFIHKEHNGDYESVE
jgi:hypothetical protein